MGEWTPRRMVAAAGVGLVAVLAIGVPTGVIQTPFYTRMTPVLWWNYPVVAASAVLIGLIAATYLRSEPGQTRHGGSLFGGGVLSIFAVGCPICNKLVVLALGASGALNYFAPIQPFLALGSVALLGYALRARLRALQICPTPTPTDSR